MFLYKFRGLYTISLQRFFVGVYNVDICYTITYTRFVSRVTLANSVGKNFVCDLFRVLAASSWSRATSPSSGGENAKHASEGGLGRIYDSDVEEDDARGNRQDPALGLALALSPLAPPPPEGLLAAELSSMEPVEPMHINAIDRRFGCVPVAFRKPTTTL